jgi:8-oxo-dGTP diphosphatase
MKHIKVVAAIILDSKKNILCVQRPEHKFDYLSHKFEFPGGKIEEGEKKEDALIREIEEELSIHIKIDYELIEVFHEYPDFRITMAAFICSSKDTPKLNEHISSVWLTKEQLDSLDWAAADVPIVSKLKETNL